MPASIQVVLHIPDVSKTQILSCMLPLPAVSTNETLALLKKIPLYDNITVGELKIGKDVRAVSH